MGNAIEIISAKDAALLIGISVQRLYRIEGLEYAHDKPRMYFRDDILKLAEEYQPVGRIGKQRRKKPCQK